MFTLGQASVYVCVGLLVGDGVYIIFHLPLCMQRGILHSIMWFAYNIEAPCGIIINKHVFITIIYQNEAI